MGFIEYVDSCAQFHTWSGVPGPLSQGGIVVVHRAEPEDFSLLRKFCSDFHEQVSNDMKEAYILEC